MCGSTKRKALLNSWKEESWEVHIHPVEVNQKLLKESTERTSKLAKERLRVQETEDKQKEVQAELDATRKWLNEIQQENKKLIIVMQDSMASKRKRKDLSVVSHQQQWSRRKELHTDVNQALLFLEDEGVRASQVILTHIQTNDKEVLYLHSGTYSKPEEMISTDDDDDLDLVLYVKDKFGLSDPAYHELSMVCKTLPRAWKLKHLAKCINLKHDITPCRNNSGVQQSLHSKLKARVSHLLENEKIRVTDVLQVKLLGDGTKICRKLNLINFTFTLLNEGDIAMSPKGNHTIAIIDAYEINDALQTAIKEVGELTAIEVNGINFKIEYFYVQI